MITIIKQQPLLANALTHRNKFSMQFYHIYATVHTLSLSGTYIPGLPHTTLSKTVSTLLRKLCCCTYHCLPHYISLLYQCLHLSSTPFHFQHSDKKIILLYISNLESWLAALVPGLQSASRGAVSSTTLSHTVGPTGSIHMPAS